MSINYPTFELNFDISSACVGQTCSCWNAEDLKTASKNAFPSITIQAPDFVKENNKAVQQVRFPSPVVSLWCGAIDLAHIDKGDVAYAKGRTDYAMHSSNARCLSGQPSFHQAA